MLFYLSFVNYWTIWWNFPRNQSKKCLEATRKRQLSLNCNFPDVKHNQYFHILLKPSPDKNLTSPRKCVLILNATLPSQLPQVLKVGNLSNYLIIFYCNLLSFHIMECTYWGKTVQILLKRELEGSPWSREGQWSR